MRVARARVKECGSCWANIENGSSMRQASHNKEDFAWMSIHRLGANVRATNKLQHYLTTHTRKPSTRTPSMRGAT